MIDKKSVMKMAQHVFKKGQGYPDRRLMHPYREWVVGLLLFTVIVVAGGAGSARLYVQYSDIDALAPAPDTDVIPYDEMMVTQALSMFKKRNETYTDFTGRTPFESSEPEDVASSSTVSAEDIEISEVGDAADSAELQEAGTLSSE